MGVKIFDDVVTNKMSDVLHNKIAVTLDMNGVWMR